MDSDDTPVTQSLYCSTCEDPLPELMRCSHCRSTLYCSVRCQREDWPLHKSHCLEFGVNGNPIYDLYLKTGGERALIKQHCFSGGKGGQMMNEWKHWISETIQALSNYSSGEVNVPDTLPENIIDGGMKGFPIIWAQHFISSCVMSNSEFKAIAEFSNNRVFDVGAGSGYNDLVLSKLGCDVVYAVDCPDGDYPPLFFNVDCSGTCDEKRVTEIASNGGCALYLWPYDYFHLDTWVRLGGKKVVTLGCFNTMSPKFNRTDTFKCTQRKEVTSWCKCSRFDDKECMEFWEYNNER